MGLAPENAVEAPKNPQRKRTANRRDVKHPT
jgi:hypothetical protein